MGRVFDLDSVILSTVKIDGQEYEVRDIPYGEYKTEIAPLLDPSGKSLDQAVSDMQVVVMAYIPDLDVEALGSRKLTALYSHVLGVSMGEA